MLPATALKSLAPSLFPQASDTASMNAKPYSVLALLLGLFWVGGCAHKPPASLPQPSQPQVTPPPIPEPEVRRDFPAPVGYYAAPYLSGDYARYPALENFIERMVSQQGYSRDYLYGLFSQVQRKRWTLDYMNREAPTPSGKPSPGSWSRYRSKFLTEQHIAAGANFWARHAAALRRASSQYGVPPEYIMGIMGVETLYGANFGKDKIIDALATLAFDYPRRSAYFLEELENFLVMTRDEGMDPMQPRGSYAGAMGFGQFMPSSFLKFAVDFDGDGRRDLWNPEDAIGSVANYFAGHGWRAGQPVAIPTSVSGTAASALESGYDTHYSLAMLAGYGVQTSQVPPTDNVRLLRLSTTSGEEYWLGYDNFYVITRYNHSTHYAMAVHQLAQAIKQRYQRMARAEN